MLTADLGTQATACSCAGRPTSAPSTASAARRTLLTWTRPSTLPRRRTRNLATWQHLPLRVRHSRPHPAAHGKPVRVCQQERAVHVGNYDYTFSYIFGRDGPAAVDVNHDRHIGDRTQQRHHGGPRRRQTRACQLETPFRSLLRNEGVVAAEGGQGASGQSKRVENCSVIVYVG